MIAWPWLVLAFGLGIGVGAWAMAFCLVDLKLRSDDARAEGRRP